MGELGVSIEHRHNEGINLLVVNLLTSEGLSVLKHLWIEAQGDNSL